MQHDPFRQDPDEDTARRLLARFIERAINTYRQQGIFPGHVVPFTTPEGETCLRLSIHQHQVEITIRFGRAQLPARIDIPRNRWFEYVDPTTPEDRGYWRIEDGRQQAIITEFLRAYGRWQQSPGP